MAVLTKKVSAPELKKSEDVKKSLIHYPFWFGGSASCFATLFTHPLDLVKVRLQTQAAHGVRLNMVQMFGNVVKSDGVLALYKGLSAAQLRQLTYSMTRFGVYETLKDRMTTADTKPSFLTLVGMASVSGFLGGFAGNPGDILNVRMQHDAALPIEKRRNYKHAIDGVIRMSREEGVASLWKGVWPNSSRAVLMTVGQLATYDGFKRVLLDYTPLVDNLTTHFTASFLAGFVATTICSPVDVIKTRVMSSHDSKGLVKHVSEIMKAEGFRWMFKGWVPSFIRVGPHTVLTFLFLEQHKKIYRKLKSLE
ncbi:mitochondrial carrier [Cucurbitaria berberidis CBS 394.84]|uniref:Mitochondrial carrier n=1 Tax=Cucurbitaria berberidis CBS 394.84 TaxID=1168544 RepID=A0A9P4GSG2_9PLEO|nr:mitochondrial carrier [Cucurbitaria berberidis CBS 394.84]KAF1851913.1 mitochondrial carrier [Cucurbitaria berberidis CBS 394.84]